jgi:hypothetical protein
MTEDQLCRRFAQELVVSPRFVDWLLGSTKFAPYRSRVRVLHEEQMRRGTRKEWWRHWWLRMPGGEERETDIFVLFETTDTRKRFALNIENKPHGASFQQRQAESYGKMAASMMAKYTDRHYEDYETVLIAPGAFMRSNAGLCKLFDRRISYEEIGAFIPEFR